MKTNTHHSFLRIAKVIALVIILAVITVLPVFAATQQPTDSSGVKYTPNKMYTFEVPNGEDIEYYLDEDLYPYQWSAGEKIYILLPLEHLLVTEEEFLSAMQAELPENPYNIQTNSLVSTFAAPSVTGTLPYNGSANLSSEQIITTPVFYAGRTGVFTFTTSNHSPSNLKLINLGASFYDLINDKWQYVLFTGKDCRNGFRVAAQISEYVKFTFNRYEAINSLNYDIKYGVGTSR